MPKRTENDQSELGLAGKQEFCLVRSVVFSIFAFNNKQNESI